MGRQAHLAHLEIRQFSRPSGRAAQVDLLANLARQEKLEAQEERASKEIRAPLGRKDSEDRVDAGANSVQTDRLARVARQAAQKRIRQAQ